jgi:hypothetical protein
VLHCFECTHWIFLGSSADRYLSNEKGITEYETEDQIDYQKSGSSAFPDLKGEFPDIPQSNRTSGRCCDKAELIGKFAASSDHLNKQKDRIILNSVEKFQIKHVKILQTSN